MSNRDIFAVILAGGSGTRFWPVSRQSLPKQFLALGSTDESLIQATARRIEPLLGDSGKSRLLVVTNHDLSPLVTEHVPQSLILAEPFGKNTAASIGLAALEVQRQNPNGVMIVLPADHSVADEVTLRSVLSSAIELARAKDALVTVGIKPESPNTAYGYIQRGESVSQNGYNVARFFEKPNLARAIEYCADENFYWNSGMFIWKASTILAAFAEHMPKLSKALDRIEAAHSDSEAKQVLEREFSSLESISIDFGVLEHAHNCMMIGADPFGWNDVGSWDAWAHHFSPDADKNVAAGDVIQVQTKNCISYASEGKRTIALLGTENLVVVDTADAVLICDRNSVQDVKLIVEALRKKGRLDLL